MEKRKQLTLARLKNFGAIKEPLVLFIIRLAEETNF